MPSLQTLTRALALLNAAFALALPTSETSLTPRQAAAPACKDVHIFLAKGWKEPYPGRQGRLAGAICYGLPSCDYEDILFENAENDDFCKSVTQGKRNGLKQVKAYVERCPGARLVVSGYSQGANVVGDMLGGGSGKFGAEGCFIQASEALDPAVSPGNKSKWAVLCGYAECELMSRVVGAALLFGDVRFVGGQSYNVLSGAAYSSNARRYPRSLARMNKFAGVLRSYCDIADPQCAGTGPGPFSIDKHLDYFDLYSDDAGGWVKWKLGY